jgi:endo-1,4-beta-xylanase
MQKHFPILRLYISFLILLVITACDKDNVYSCDDSVSIFRYANYPIGTSVNIEELNNNQQYRSIVLKQFNSVTAENAFKPEYLHPFPGIYDWVAADSLAAYCAKNHKRLHGHTLIWHWHADVS